MGKQPGTKKGRAKRDALAATPYKVTPAQKLMRDEMESQPTLPGMEKKRICCGTPINAFHSEGCVYGYADSGVSKGVMSLSDVFDETVGKASESTISVYGAFAREVPSMALEIIGEHPDLSMGLKQWQIVQNMVEAGIRRGWDERGSA